ncbi:MAG: 16S rRNA (uracil(1498)-N(3))-methyltransferase [Oscillospiraceae bacterium]|nr:16S rRNA (uracil(1498)-N(3))-methyltransferase [Oscillospiraceae bacterium]
MGDMPRFFLLEGFSGGEVVLEGDEARHAAQVLRLKAGDALTISDGVGREAHCRVTDITHGRVRAAIESVSENGVEPGIKMCFYPSLSKGERFSWTIQKLCELGAWEITPILSDRCVAREWSEQKANRYRRILMESAKQCGRARIPALNALEPFDECVRRQRTGVTLFCYEGARGSLKAALESAGDFDEIHVFTGPEGGYTLGEAELIRESGIPSVSLGKIILRCETAPLAAAAAVLYACGQM